MNSRPLTGITVVELGHSVAAPYAGLILADLGARVIKVENPSGGDYSRDWGPPFWNGTSSMFQCLNRGKHGITVDFTNPTEASALRDLIVTEANVVIQNLRAGALERFGLDRDSLCAKKPALIWCDIGAFGSAGPLANKPGYDPLMQAFTGIMSVTGTGADEPVRVGVSIVDMGAGMWAVIGILASLLARRDSGCGARVATSLFETGLAWMTVPLAAYCASGEVRRPFGSGVAEIVPYQAFQVTDGWVMVAAGNDNLFRRLCQALSRNDLSADERFATNSSRVKHREILISTLQDEIGRYSVASVTTLLDEIGVPNAPIQSVKDVAHHPQTVSVGLVQPCTGDSLPLVGTPLTIGDARPRATSSAPKLGEHNAVVLGNV